MTPKDAAQDRPSSRVYAIFSRAGAAESVRSGLILGLTEPKGGVVAPMSPACGAVTGGLGGCVAVAA